METKKLFMLLAPPPPCPPVLCGFSLGTLFSEALARNAGTEKQMKTAEMFTVGWKKSAMLLSFPETGKCLL